MHDWVTNALSPEQKAPLLRETPNASILAAAGSGKTRTLTHMMVSDIASGIAPANIIAFTFTVKAAEEMLARVINITKQHLPDVNASEMYSGTRCQDSFLIDFKG